MRKNAESDELHKLTRNFAEMKFETFLNDKRKSDKAREEEKRNRRRNEAFRTEMCRAFQRGGHCFYGDNCRFAHCEAELRIRQLHPNYKTTLCRNYAQNGFCIYGARCQFIHRDQPTSSNPSSAPSLFMHSAFNIGANGHSNFHSIHRTDAFDNHQQSSDYFEATSLMNICKQQQLMPSSPQQLAFTQSLMPPPLIPIFHQKNQQFCYNNSQRVSFLSSHAPSIAGPSKETRV
uniref:C3H1-type domain-containing protein n=1 Tax=Meloidogyne hapla TaxID=6305 RepID=A0A1I8B610_MELHA